MVMDIGTYNRREKILKLREELLTVEEDRITNGLYGNNKIIKKRNRHLL